MQATRTLTLADVLVPREGAWRLRNLAISKALASDIALVVAFAGLTALFAQIIIRLPFTTVPITGQTFAVLLTGGALGAWRGASSITLYMVAGFFLPVYAPASTGQLVAGSSVHFIFPWSGSSAFPWDISSGGYIVGFILAAFAVGYFAQKGWDRKPWLIGGMLASSALVYIPGLLWLAYLISSGWVHPVGRPLGDLIVGQGTLEKTLVGGLYPFILGDMAKLYLATLALPSAWALVSRIKR